MCTATSVSSAEGSCTTSITEASLATSITEVSPIPSITETALTPPITEAICKSIDTLDSDLREINLKVRLVPLMNSVSLIDG
jgi:hypothetical protein